MRRCLWPERTARRAAARPLAPAAGELLLAGLPHTHAPRPSPPPRRSPPPPPASVGAVPHAPLTPAAAGGRAVPAAAGLVPSVPPQALLSRTSTVEGWRAAGPVTGPSLRWG